jgi:6-pyruvoyl tetrahydropterin synthase/QueD family protein
MAHTLYEYNGLCRNIHGHSYNLEVTISGEPRKEPGHPKDGMVLDFSELKDIVRTHVVHPFDHALAVWFLKSRSNCSDKLPTVLLWSIFSLLPKIW